MDDGRIRLGDGVVVYLERTLATPDPVPPGVAPRPYGVAPTAVAPDGSVLAAVAPGEAVWLGFGAVDSSKPATVRVRAERPEPLDAVTGGPWEDALSSTPSNHLVCPPDYCLPGIRGPAGYVPFGQVDSGPGGDVVEQLTILSYAPSPGRVGISLVTPAAFTRATGVVPEPIDVESSYQGWLLP